MPNVVLLTFANDRSAYLDQLKAESRALNEVLQKLADREAIRLVREENASTDDVVKLISKYKDDILLFHFGGHADDDTLRFAGGSGQAEGIAELLGALPNLKVVFLNGCSTLGQVERLLERGVPAVIATRTPIDDNKARLFAETFYHHLAHQGSVQRAFELARAGLLSRFRNVDADDLQVVPVARGVRLPQPPDPMAMPWGLYVAEDRKDALEWTLPAQKRSTADTGGEAFQVNEYLRYVPQAMAEASEPFAKRLRAVESEREALKLMVETFPWNIGSQVARLVGLQPPLSAPTPERLGQLLSTYLACKQFIYFVTLSEMWQEIDEHNLDMAREDLHQVFNLTRQNALTFDFLGRADRLQGIMENSGISYFVPELRNLGQDLKPDTAGGAASSYLDNLLERYATTGPEAFQDQIVEQCAEAEKYLAVWLYRLAFLSKYWMVTVRDIQIERPRHREPSFKHRVGRLNAFNETMLGLFEEPRAFPRFFFDNCVILFRDLEQAQDCLVLTPFYIDKNAYVANRPPQMQLFTFGYKGPEDRPHAQYHFINSGQNLFRAFAEERYQLHTGIELGSGGDKAARALMPWEKRSAKGVQPYASLKEQFDTLF